MLKTPAIMAAFAAMALASPAMAQAGKDKPAYYDSAPWQVLDIAKIYCRLEHGGSETGQLTLAKASAEASLFEFRLKTSADYYTPPSDTVEWRFDDTPVQGTLLAGKYYQLREANAEAEALFRRSNTLTITHNDRTVATIDLKGSAVAFRKTLECANQYPNSVIPRMPVAPPPPQRLNMGSTNTPPKTARTGPVRAPKIEANQPPNRLVTPIAVNNWFVNDMHRLPPDVLRMQREVGFSVLVNERGLVDACDVTSSSGSGQVDEFTCRVIARRARFDPQTDENGKPVPARFSSIVRWEYPTAEAEPLKEGESD